MRSTPSLSFHLIFSPLRASLLSISTFFHLYANVFLLHTWSSIYFKSTHLFIYFFFCLFVFFASLPTSLLFAPSPLESPPSYRFALCTSAPFPPVSSFSCITLFPSLPTSRTFSHSERVQQEKERWIRVIICTYRHRRRRLRRCVKPGNWFGTRKRAESVAPRRQTARHACTSHLHVAATPSAVQDNNTVDLAENL